MLRILKMDLSRFLADQLPFTFFSAYLLIVTVNYHL